MTNKSLILSINKLIKITNMNRKIANSLLFSAVLLSSGVMSSCKDYDDDINSLNDRVTAVESSIAELQKKLESGKWVVSFEQNTGKNGYILTLSDGNKLEILNGKNGTDGTNGTNGINGVDGKNGTTWEIDPETKHWIAIDADGKKTDTGISAEGLKGEQGLQGPAGEPGKSPRIGDDKTWEIYNPETGKYESTNIPAGSQTSYVVEYKAYWELYVATGSNTGEYSMIILPKTESITSIDVYSLEGNVLGDPNVVLAIGRAGEDISFNGKKYKKDQVLVAGTTGLVLQTHPLEADAKLYTFSLWDSKKQIDCVEVSAVEQNTSDMPLSISRAATENKGFWNIAISMNEGTDASIFNSSSAYSLHTNTLNKECAAVVSKYNISIKLAERTTVNPIIVDNTLQINEVHTWNNVLAKSIKGGVPTDVVDWYLEIPEDFKEQAQKDGVVLNKENKTLVVNKTNVDGINYINYHYLTMDGRHEVTPLQLTASNVKVITLEKDFEWSFDTKNRTVRLAVNELGALDGLVQNNQIVGNVEYAFMNTPVLVDGMPVFSPVNLNEILGGVKFIKDEKIEGKWYAEMTFDETKIFAESYTASIKLEDPIAGQTRTLDFKININAPVVFNWASKRDNAFFDGNNVKVYPMSDGSESKYDIKTVYKLNTGDWEFVYFGDGSSYKDGWFTQPQGGIATVPNTDVNKPRKITVLYRPFNNPNLNASTDEFFLDVRSEIYDGKIEFSKSLEVSNGKNAELKTSDFKFSDFKGVSYKLDDKRVKDYTITLADNNANKYIKLEGDIKNGTVTISRKDDTVIVNPQTCKLKFTITDIWGQNKEYLIDVIAK